MIRYFNSAYSPRVRIRSYTNYRHSLFPPKLFNRESRIQGKNNSDRTQVHPRIKYETHPLTPVNIASIFRKIS